MTYSIVAREAATGHFGIAVASRFFAVGALVPHMRGGVGAIATQAFVSPLYGTDGIALLARGATPAEALQAVTGRDEGRHSRQVHMIDAAGRSAAFNRPSFSRLAQVRRPIFHSSTSSTSWPRRRSSASVAAPTLRSTMMWPGWRWRG